VAADIVGSKIFGLSINDVPHIKLAIDRDLSSGIKSIEDLDITGDIKNIDNIDILGDISESGKYPSNLYNSFHPNVKIIKGKNLACKEGCVNNPLTLLQILYYDHRAKGGFSLVMGKGFSEKTIDGIKGRVLICGHCAIEEIGKRIIKKLGRDQVYLSGDCNDLCATAEGMFHLTGVNPIDLVTINPAHALFTFLTARIKQSNSKVPNPLSHILKMV
jgi:hypothetical protein